MDLQAKLRVTPVVLRKDLEEFLAKIPVEAELEVKVTVTEPDRPYESRRTDADLIAKWKS